MKCLLMAVSTLLSIADSAATRDRSLVDWLKDFKETIGGDPLFERLVSQIWSVHRANVKDNSTV